MKSKEELNSAYEVAKQLKRNLSENLDMDSGVGKGKMLVGILAGMAAGAALALLFAPDSGSNSRKKIAKKGNEYLEDVTEKYDELIETLASAFEKAKASAYTAADEVGVKAKEYKNSLIKKEDEAFEKYS